MSGETRGSERRLNLLTGDWVLISPHRLQRPWQGTEHNPRQPRTQSFDPECYLCPGNARAGGARNPSYAGVHVFANDFPALTKDPTSSHDAPDGLFVVEAETGLCRVMCYSPDHGRTLSGMSHEEVRAVVDAWTEEFISLSAQPDVSAVTIFENRGDMMGASNPHPHGQIWATSSLPNELKREDDRQKQWFAEKGKPLLEMYLARELADGARVIALNAGFVALVPFWAVWPFEAMILPRRNFSGMDEMSADEKAELADILRTLTAGYDALFATPFPYSMGFHQLPGRGGANRHFTFHAHFYPPLLRSASVRKYMVGFEMLGMPQRDLTPEEAASRLRAVMRP